MTRLYIQSSLDSGARTKDMCTYRRWPLIYNAPVVATNTVPDPVNRNPASSGVM